MTGIRIPPFDQGSVGTESSIWPGIVAAIVLVAGLGAAIWTYLRTRPAECSHTRPRRAAESREVDRTNSPGGPGAVSCLIPSAAWSVVATGRWG